MKVQLLLPVSIVVSVCLVGVMKTRKKEYEKDDRVARFHDIKLRVTLDVLGEYRNEKAHLETTLGAQESAHHFLVEQCAQLRTSQDGAEAQEDTCRSGQKVIAQELKDAEGQLSSVKADIEKEGGRWASELDALKRQLAAKSPVCGFLKPGATEARTLCGEEALKPEEAKAEAPKPEEAKAEAPKPEEAKPEAPKPAEAKPEAPKPEEAKPEAPKPAEAKPEAPKAEEAKAEAPKPAEPKAEAPKPAEPKAEAPKV